MKKRLIFYVVLFAIYSIIALYSSINNNELTTYSLIGWGVIIIPIIFSIIPLFDEELKKIKFDKTILSNSTFTDRKDDLRKILCDLNIKDSIQLIGSETGCGKSWLAKKLCDLINDKKELRSYIGKGFRTKIKKSIYIYSLLDENQLHNLFVSNKISHKTLIIFDDICKGSLKSIKSYQEKLGFKLIYILNEAEETDICIHSIEKFEQKHLVPLHDKIIKIYPLVERLSEDELRVVHSLTDGNILKISEILSRSEHVNWIKVIAKNDIVEYMQELNKIKITLFIGKYDIAAKELDNFKEKYKNSLHINNDMFFHYTIIKSDCEHLLNNYTTACAIIKTLNFNDTRNENFTIELYLAHYLKHLWENSEALEILNMIASHNKSAYLDTFGIYLAEFFITSNSDNSLDKFKELFLQIDDKANHKYIRYQIYYKYYNKCEFSELISMADTLIELYKNENNRLLANALVLRAELFRIFKKYNLAFQDYEQSLLVTNDKNIKTQVYLMIYYLKKIKKVQVETNFQEISAIDMVRLCENNKYSELVFSQINSITLGDENKDIIQKNIDNKIMPIL